MEPSAGWPFWAGTSDSRVDEALRLTGLRPGERLVDLGCGDGRVLVRAAEAYGAEVTGVELDPALAEQARRALAANSLDGTVVEADFADVPIEAEVVFAFLSPATLQRLRPRLEALPPGSRVVTTGYAVPGWIPSGLGDRCFLYRLPADQADADRQARGWVSDGALISLPADAPGLVAVKLAHPGGPVAVGVSSAGLNSAGSKSAGLDGWLEVLAGADQARPGDEVTVDLRFGPCPVGTVAAGRLEVAGAAPFSVFAVVDEGDTGIWGLSEAGCAHVAGLLERGELAGFIEDARRRTS